MPRKTGSAKKAARRAKDRDEAEQATPIGQTAAPEQPPAPAIDMPPIPVLQPPIIEQQLTASTDRYSSLNGDNVLLNLKAGRRRRADVLRESILNTLGLLHDYQQHKYQRYSLEHTDVEIFRECKTWLRQTYERVPDFDFGDEYIDA